MSEYTKRGTPIEKGLQDEGPPFPPRARFLKRRWEQKNKQGV